MKFETKRQATEYWVRGFNALPLSILLKAFDVDFFDEVEVLATPRVECGNCRTYHELGTELCDSCEKDGLVSDILFPAHETPMWGTVWTFDDASDDNWAYHHADKLAEHGFMVYYHDDLGVFIGIDGAGYDFYEAHWIPLYEERGLQWHAEEVAI